MVITNRIPEHSMRITRIAFTIAAFCAPAFSQGLTTIQDTLFKADGTRFSGTLSIQWSTFDAANLGQVIQQSKTVTVANGNLQVQLAPNSSASSPANVYRVFYQSDGRNQFSETWSVPTSPAPLKIAGVRTGTLASTPGTGTGGTGGTGAQTPVLEADIVGLLNDLDQRPVKGSGFGTGRAAVINQNGEVETAVGDSNDCVHVDGTSAPCAGATPTFVDAETPGGLVDGVNKTFTLAGTPSGASLQLFRNGLYMTPAFDYALTGNTLQFVANNIPQPQDTLTASYRLDPTAASIILSSDSGPAKAIRSAQVICSANGIYGSTTSYTSLGSCTVPVAFLKTGDRIEIRFTLTHSGTGSAFDVQTLFGTSTIIQRHGSVQDAAFVGRIEASVATGTTQISAESYGSVLTLLPSIQSTNSATVDVKIDIRAALSTAGTKDRVTLTNYTVIRYPAI